MALYNRAAHIHQLAKEYQAYAIMHQPIHPALGGHNREFDEAYPLGRVSEELTRPLLHQRFPYPKYVVTAHCDVQVETRRIGKSVELNGARYPLPDYEVGWRHGKQSHGLYIDIKSKEYHSFFRNTGHLEQFIDEEALDGYNLLADMRGFSCWILFHLWPNQLMHSFGKADKPRYTAGNGHFIPERLLDAFIRSYPVDDIYYQISVKDIREKGMVRVMKHDNGRQSRGYFIEVRHMAQRPGGDTRLWEPTLLKGDA
jgi:hypothetical protein